MSGASYTRKAAPRRWLIAAITSVFAILLFSGCRVSESIDESLDVNSSANANAPVSHAIYDLSLAGQTKIKLAPQSLTVSSQNSKQEGPTNLLDPNATGSYWHVHGPRREVAPFIQVDLDRLPEPLATVRMRPRAGTLDQMWNGNLAAAQASNDGDHWSTLARLAIDAGSLKDAWLSFPIANTKPYRFYRLVFFDQDFRSLGRLEFYRFPGASEGAVADIDGPIVEGSTDTDVSTLNKVDMRQDQLFANSENNPTEAVGVLATPGINGYWHVKLGDAKSFPAWVRFDLGLAPVRVTTLRVFPRAGYRDQLWNGATAGFQGSVDGENWVSLAQLSVSTDRVHDDWIAFSFENKQAFRFYRITISDTAFRSLGRVELLTPDAVPRSSAPAKPPVGLPTSAPTPSVSRRTFEATPASVSRNPDVADYQRIRLSTSQVSASSINSPTESAEALVQEGIGGYWHAKPDRPRDEAVWVRFDLGGQPVPVNYLLVRPRAGFPEQLWTGGSAGLQGSTNGNDWVSIAQLPMPSGAGDQWIGFGFANTRSFRYIRIYIQDSTFRAIGRVQLYTHGDADAPRVNGAAGADYGGGAKIPVYAGMLSASSSNSAAEGPGHLVDPGIRSYWHIKPGAAGPDEATWIRVDLGSVQAVSAIRVLPRPDLPDQLWSGPQALWQGSSDGQGWNSLARLVLPTSRDYTWYGFGLPAGQPAYRYFRLLISDPNFLSMGRLELYGGTSLPAIDGIASAGINPSLVIAPREMSVSVSSSNSPTEGASELMQPGTEGYWHIRVGQPQVEPSWIRIDLGAARSVSSLRILPRTGLAWQMWTGAQATWQWSADGQTWVPIATLSLPAQKVGDWYTFPLAGVAADHRYYRLSITDPGFLSIGRIELYR